MFWGHICKSHFTHVSHTCERQFRSIRNGCTRKDRDLPRQPSASQMLTGWGNGCASTFSGGRMWEGTSKLDVGCHGAQGNTSAGSLVQTPPFEVTLRTGPHSPS